MVVVVAAEDERPGGRDQPTHPPDRRHQLGDRVLGGHRAIQQGRVQRPPLTAGQHPGLGDHRPHRLKDPLGTVGGAQPAPPQGQHRRMEALIGQRKPRRHLPGNVAGQLLCRLAVRQPLQGLQHHHGRDHIGRDRGPATTRREQVGEQLVREQLPPVVGQEAIDRTSRHQVAAQGRSVQQLDASGVSRPLHAGSLPHRPPTPWGFPDLFAQQAPSVSSC
jgi:hypothetical protein